MNFSRIISKISIVALLVIAVFGLTEKNIAFAYNSTDEARDAQYVGANIYKIDDIKTKATDDMNTWTTDIYKAKTLLQKINAATPPDPNSASTLQGVITSMQAELDGAKDAYNEILTYDQHAHKMLTDLQNDAFNIDYCWTSVGNSAGATQNPANGNCAKNYDQDLLAPAQNLYNTIFAPREQHFKDYENTMNTIMASSDKYALNQDEINQAQSDAEKEVPKAALDSCFTISNGMNVGVCIRMGIGWIAYAFMILLSSLLTLGGYILDRTIDYTVFHISQNINALYGIDLAWVFFRNVANLSFIFVLLYVSICTILQINNVNAKRTIVQIVVAAILINFSLFITKVIIDFSNIIALALYNNIKLTDSMSSTFMKLLGMSGIFDASTGQATSTVNAWAQDWGTLVVTMIGNSTVIFTAAFSFLTAAWLFLFRYVILVILLLSSPIAFMGNVIPQLKRQAARWWDALTGQALFPILYFFFIWITIKIGQELFAKQGLRTFAQAFTNPASNGSAHPIDVVIRYVIIIIFMNAAIVLAKTQSGRVGGSAAKIMEGGVKRIDGFRRNIKSAGVGVAQRNLINRPAKGLRSLYNSSAGKLATSKFGKGAAAVGGFRFGGEKLKEKISGQGVEGFTGTARRFAGAVASAPLRAAGAATFGAARAGVIGADRAIQEGLTSVENYKAKGTENLAEYDKYVDKRDVALKDAVRKEKDKQIIEKGTTIDFSDKTRAVTKEMSEDIAKLAEVVGDLSTRELEETGKDKLTNATFLAMLSNSQFDNMLKSDKLAFSDDEKKDLKKKRGDAKANWAQHGTFGKLTDDQRKAIKDAKKADQTPPKFGTFEESFLKMKSSEAAEQPAKVLIEAAKLGLVDGSILDQVASKGNMSREDRNKLRQEIETFYENEQNNREITKALAQATEAYKKRTNQQKIDKKKVIKIRPEDIDSSDEIEREVKADKFNRMNSANRFLNTSDKGANL